jgi:hypothetical protein
MDIFKQLLPQIAQLKPLAADGETICWEALDQSGTLLGYAFSKDVPELSSDFPGAEDMDKYKVNGIIDPKEYKIMSIDISLHPEGPEQPWTTEITEPKFKNQYLGLSVKEIELSPDGKIDAISEATLSSTWVTTAIRDKVEEIIKGTKSAH